MSEHLQMKQSKKIGYTFQKQATIKNNTHIPSPASIIQRARIDPKSLTAAGVLQLQRTIGNRAVGRLLSEMRNPSKVQQVPIQRQQTPEEEESLQGMFGKEPEDEACPSCMQRPKIPEEEEPLQGKFETIQRLEPEEEEKLQMKYIMQRLESPEEEPLQGVFENKPEQAAYTSCIQRKELEEEEPLQKKSENNTGMPDNLKAGVESLSGIDMSDVKVHYNSSKPAEVGALAYTQGTNIHVAPGQERYLPHEAWHVVQQAQGQVKPTMRDKGIPINDDAALEHEANIMGKEALQTHCSEKNTFVSSRHQTPNNLIYSIPKSPLETQQKMRSSKDWGTPVLQMINWANLNFNDEQSRIQSIKVFFSTEQGYIEQIRVGRPYIGKSGVGSIQINWFFPEAIGIVRGIGLTLHVLDDTGKLGLGNIWLPGLVNWDINHTEISVDWNAVIDRLLTDQYVQMNIGYLIKLLSSRKTESDDKWARFGDRRKGGGAGGSGSTPSPVGTAH